MGGNLANCQLTILIFYPVNYNRKLNFSSIKIFYLIYGRAYCQSIYVAFLLLFIIFKKIGPVTKIIKFLLQILFNKAAKHLILVVPLPGGHGW